MSESDRAEIGRSMGDNKGDNIEDDAAACCAATVANLTLVAAKAGLTGKTGSGPSASSAQVAGMVNSAANAATAWLGQIRTLTLLVSALVTKSLFPIRGFRPGF